MSLSERVTFTHSGEKSSFTVNRIADTNTTIKYTQNMYLEPPNESNFSAVIFDNNMLRSRNTSLMQDRFVTIREYSENQMIDEYIFYTTNQAHKVPIRWNIKKNQKYGSNHYEIILQWDAAHKDDKISKEHIYLKLENQYYNKKFGFLKDMIGPVSGTSCNYVDNYIIEIPNEYRNTIKIEDFYIEGDELFQLKYELIPSD